ncbi:MAG: hypothetical protein Q9181_003350 [Wetmoreana brouardii]
MLFFTPLMIPFFNLIEDTYSSYIHFSLYSHQDAKLIWFSIVFKKPLALFSQSPMTGFYRDGYCRSGPEDGGNHAVAGLLTKEFLDFSASRGNNLRSIGLEPGCKWCLCTARWKEAMEAAKGKDDPIVPKVYLHATHDSALENGITMDALKKFAAEPEARGGGGSLEKEFPITPGQKGGIAKETH